MGPCMFYEPFYFEIERVLNDASLSKQDRKADTPVVRTFKPRQAHVHINDLCFLYSNTEYRLDVHEDIEKNTVTATYEIPGFSKDEVQINFQNGKLTVFAETKKSENYAETGYTLRERVNGKLSRTLQLPQGVKVCGFSFQR